MVELNDRERKLTRARSFSPLCPLQIGYAGEIVHGKTSLVSHDSRGLFYGLPQDLKSTRYHSLAAEIVDLPAELQVTSTTKESGVIMGVRHRKYTVEAVQYHPESVMSEGGMELMGNFLRFTGGTWDECKGFGVGEDKINGQETVLKVLTIDLEYSISVNV